MTNLVFILKFISLGKFSPTHTIPSLSKINTTPLSSLPAPTSLPPPPRPSSPATTSAIDTSFLPPPIIVSLRFFFTPQPPFPSSADAGLRREQATKLEVIVKDK
ncbi:hypothetical protein S83_000143 [Arachis hypogaea]|uniref:Uncharacterized protein n=1 Tax=Arachis hypogaea TaxID=3818 RepID=A0A445EWZ8_ARAHY|nr:hypothetical protein Ahy_A01g004754 isoform C [Arachis hypogaea]